MLGAGHSWPRSAAPGLAAVAACLLSATASGQEQISAGQRVYLAVYSAIGFASQEKVDVAVTLSFRNLDERMPITIESALYYDTDGRQITDLLEAPRTLAPFGSTQVLIKQTDFSGDVGANVVVEWSAGGPAAQPLFEAVMVGSRGTQAFAFTSRGVVLE
ncbi:DUF3124 domain-containing protein [Microbaculum marinum]|uniref:DUF3124 domain-containing protein n=1 Tax=Microbaculum marinum TaxID=1764581 RepID=A0AAW9RPX9_9HYPH